MRRLLEGRSRATGLLMVAVGFVAAGFGYGGMYVVVAGSALGALVLMRSPFLSGAAGLSRAVATSRS